MGLQVDDESFELRDLNLEVDDLVLRLHKLFEVAPERLVSLVHVLVDLGESLSLLALVFFKLPDTLCDLGVIVYPRVTVGAVMSILISAAFPASSPRGRSWAVRCWTVSPSL